MRITQKNLLNNFKNLSQKDALTITKLINGSLDVQDFPIAQKRIVECYNKPTNKDLIFHVLNDLIKGYGVDAVPYEIDAMYDNEFIFYVNQGDTYSVTILYNPEKSRFEIGDWGSLYEISPAYQDASNQDCENL